MANKTKFLFLGHCRFSTRNLCYSQTSVFEHNLFWKAVQKPICSKTESYFPITNNVKEINLFHVSKE